MDKIKNHILLFKDLEEGWGFGEGGPISDDVINKALEIYELGEEKQLKCQIFPGYNLEIDISFYNKNHFMDFIINKDLTVEFIYEVGIGSKYEEIENILNISNSEISNYLSILEKI